MLMQVDTSIVGVLLVIEIGSRDAARNALAPIGQRHCALKTRCTAGVTRERTNF